MLIVYVSNDNVLVCDPDAEKSMLDLWFARESGRDLEDYDREECPSGIVEINPKLVVDWD